MRKDIIILGTGGLAKEMALVIEHVNAREHRWDIKGFIGDKAEEIGKDLGCGKVIGDDAWLLAQNLEADLVLGIGYPKIRAKVMPQYLQQRHRFQFPNLIHPSAILDFHRIELGEGNVITAGCVFTCDIKVGSFNLFNLNTTVGHDVIVGDYNVFNPSVNLSGNVQIGNGVLTGTGCQILERLSIGNNVTMGAGAVVTKNVPDSLTVIGVPAKPKTL